MDTNNIVTQVIACVFDCLAGFVKRFFIQLGKKNKQNGADFWMHHHEN